MWLKLYAKTKFPFVPIYGGFPVKLITYVGKPIEYDASLTPEELQSKVNIIMYNMRKMCYAYANIECKYLNASGIYFQVADALQNLIKEHQRIPGNISWALLERICNIKN